MAKHYHSIMSELTTRIKEEYTKETTLDTDDLIALPYPYVVPGKDKKSALFYWDTYFINLGLIKMRLIDQARHNVENLIYLFRKYNFIPSSNRKDLTNVSQPPLLPWMVRDVYRATGDKEWLRRVLPDVLAEYKFWTNKKHTSPTGLYHYNHDVEQNNKTTNMVDINDSWMSSPRFENIEELNPIDLNAFLYRNTKLIFDLQKEAEGKGNQQLVQKAEQLKKLVDMCWDDKDGFYYDINFVNKKQSRTRTLAGFVPLFVKMVDEKRAKRIIEHLSCFSNPGGLSCTEELSGKPETPWTFPRCYAPYLYFTIKGLIDYDFMEDAADIGTNWLEMVLKIYKETGDFFEWYNVKDQSTSASKNISNPPIMGVTVGTYAALIDALGLN